MPRVLRRLVSSAVVIVLVFLPGIASAQSLGGPRPQTTALRSHGFVTGFKTLFGVQRIGAGGETAFDWDLDLSIDFNLFVVGFARGNVFGNFETIVGSELRAIDPNQSNFTVDLSIFFRLPRGELAVTFHHVSRHLVDRARQASVSWNMLGIAYGDRFSIGQLEVDAGVRSMGTLLRRGVDYLGQFEAYVNIAHPITSGLSIIAGADAAIIPVRSEKFGRRTRNGGRVEAGMRFLAGAAAVDLFAAWERRIDASSVDRDTATWAQVGLRVAAPAP
ncbi:MAG: hypothetical protein V3T48_01170 [Vicinamibacterales bacterium]